MSQYCTYETLRKEVDKAVKNIAALGYEELLSQTHIVGTSEKATRWLGRCVRKKEYGKTFYILKFNLPYLRMVSDEEALSTIYHEVAHCINGGMTHKDEWKLCASKISMKYNIPVTRVSSDSEYSRAKERLRAQKIQYVPVCDDCGKEHSAYIRRGTTVQAIMAGSKDYSCRVCGSHNIHIDVRVPAPEGAEISITR